MKLWIFIIIVAFGVIAWLMLKSRNIERENRLKGINSNRDVKSAARHYNTPVFQAAHAPPAYVQAIDSNARYSISKSPTDYVAEHLN